MVTALVFPEFFKLKLLDWTGSSMSIPGGFYLWIGFLAVLHLFFLAFTPLGNLRHGMEHPEYGRFSWMAMKYITGMGAGLLLRAVKESVINYTQPPKDSVYPAGEFAFQYTFFHWGMPL
ncbi:MAG: BCCT family transporter [Cyclobacteriaceae bacterium]